MIIICQLDPQEQTSVKFKEKYTKNVVGKW